jgi:hypothetical protein
MKIATAVASVPLMPSGWLCVTDENPLLASFEAKPVPEFQQKIVEPVEQLVLQMRFAHDLLWLEAEEFEYVRIADRDSRIGGFRAASSQFREFFLVRGKAGALVVEAGDLALQFANRPVAADALDFVEKTLGFVRNRN